MGFVERRRDRHRRNAGVGARVYRTDQNLEPSPPVGPVATLLLPAIPPTRRTMQLEIRNISKTYRNGVQALKNVSLTIPPGMYGLLGPNGAGKSTLMRTIATLQQPDTGTITLGDLDLLKQKDEVRKTLGYLPQEFGVYPNVTAERLLDHFAVLEGITDKQARKETVDALLHQTNLWNARKQKLGGYSGGMRQRFGIAVALLANPTLVIVDEPTAGLDPAERVRFLNLLGDLGEDSIVILLTHIVEDVSELCRRMAIIDNGEIVLEAPIARRSTCKFISLERQSASWGFSASWHLRRQHNRPELWYPSCGSGPPETGETMRPTPRW